MEGDNGHGGGAKNLRPLHRAGKLLGRFGAHLYSFWDTDLAIVGALVATGLGLAQITDPETTVALTLAVLAAVAGSLLRDRAQRKSLQRSVNELDSRLSSVSRAYSNPLPFDVISATYRWEFDEEGKTASVRKEARVRFVHNGVWTILAWHTDIDSIKHPAARLLFKNGGSHKLAIVGDLNMGDGKKGKVIALDRQYKQNQVLRYEYSFESHENFTGEQEWLSIAIETFTENLAVEIVWPSRRVPSVVWIDIDGEPEQKVKKAKSRKVTKMLFENLDAGQSIPVKWLWDVAEKPQASKS